MRRKQPRLESHSLVDRIAPRRLKIEAYGDAIIFFFAAMLGLVVALDATPDWLWRLLIFCAVTFTLGLMHPAIRFAWSKVAN
jgi:hypothetical protein